MTDLHRMVASGGRTRSRLWLEIIAGHRANEALEDKLYARFARQDAKLDGKIEGLRREVNPNWMAFVTRVGSACSPSLPVPVYPLASSSIAFTTDYPRAALGPSTLTGCPITKWAGVWLFQRDELNGR